MRTPAALVLVVGGLLLGPLAGAATAHAADLEVTSEAARSGTAGLRVTVGTSCASPDAVSVDGQTLTGPATVEGCDSVSSAGTTVASGDVVFRAGQRIVLGDGFSVASGASFVAQIDGTLQPDAYLEDRTPRRETHYAAGFYLDADALDMAFGERFDLFTGRARDGTVWFAVVLKRAGTLEENRLVLEARLDDGTIDSTEGHHEVVLPPGWSWVSVDWKAWTTHFGGPIRLYLDGWYQASAGGVNSNGRIDTVRLGAEGVDPGTSGSFDVDRFVSRIAGPIAPP